MTTAAEYEQVPTEDIGKPLKELMNEKDDKLLKEVKTMEDFTHMKTYCMLILWFSEFVLISGAGNMVYMIFAGAAPSKVSCRGPLLEIEDICQYGGLSSVPLYNCSLQVDYEFKSVNVEFGHFCKETDWVKSSISVQMGGVLVGTLVFGSLSDRMGRKKVLAFSFLMTSLVSLICSFANNLMMFTALRTILGFFNGGVIGTYGVYKMEHIPKRHRFWVATVIAWAPNFILINGLAYFSGDWRTFQRVILALSTPAFILYWFIHESPRWLIQRGRIDEAREILQKIQKMDKETDYEKEEMQRMLDSEYEKHLAREGKLKNYNVRHLFYTKQMAAATIVLCAGVLFTSIINYGLMFNIEKLSGSLFLNSIIMGALRWSTNIISGLLDYKCKSVGRKAVHFASQASIAFCLAGIAIVYCLGVEKEYSFLIRVATIIAAATTSQIFITKSILTMEFYPTVVRNSAMAFKSTCSRIGTILAPQLFILTPWRSLPYVIITAMSIFDTLAFQAVLPETKGRPLPDGMPTKDWKKIPKRKTGDDDVLVKA